MTAKRLKSGAVSSRLNPNRRPITSAKVALIETWSRRTALAIAAMLLIHVAASFARPLL